MLELPLPQRLVVGGERPRRKRRRPPPSRLPGQPLMVTTRATPSSWASSIAPRRRCGVAVADRGIGVERVAGGVHAGEAEAVRAQLAGQAVADGRLAQEPGARSSWPGACAHPPTPISMPPNPALGAPRERLFA